MADVPGAVAMTLQALIDRAAIQDVLLRYARGVDRRDVALVASCFTPDAGYDGALGRGPIGDVLTRLGERMARYTSTLHFLGNQTIELAGDAARSATYALAHHVLPDGRHRVVAVRYCDDLVRAGGTWHICRRMVHREWERTDASAPPSSSP